MSQQAVFDDESSSIPTQLLSASIRLEGLYFILSITILLISTALFLPEVAYKQAPPIVIDAFLIVAERITSPIRHSFGSSYEEARLALASLLVTLSYTVPAALIFLAGRSAPRETRRFISWTWLVIFMGLLYLPIAW